MNITLTSQQATILQEECINSLECMKFESAAGLGLDEARRDALLELVGLLGKPMTWLDVAEISPEEMMQGLHEPER